MTDQPRQRFTAGVHVSPDHGTVQPRVSPAHDDHDIASVEIVEGLRIQSDHAETLRLIAAAFTQAADSIDALHTQAVA